MEALSTRASLWATVVLAGVGVALTLVVAGSSTPLWNEDALARSIQGWPGWFEEVSRGIRLLTGTQLVIGFSVLFAAWLFIEGQRWRAGCLVVALALLVVTQSGVKDIVDRPRPTDEHVDVRDSWTSPSYPSGHLMSGTFLLGVIAVSGLPGVAGRRPRQLVAGLALAAVAVNAAANVYMGVHWPTDVAGGLLLGGAFAMAVDVDVAPNTRRRQRTGSIGPVCRRADVTDEMEFFDVIYHTRAMRRLKPDPVPEEVLLKLIDAANKAPSASNRQNARWIVVRDPAQKLKVADLNRTAIEKVRIASGAPAPEPGGRLSAGEYQAAHLQDVPAIVFACVDLTTEREDNFLTGSRVGGSVWPGVQNLLLSARALGLGATPTTRILREREELRAVLNLPENIEAICMIPVGYPMGKFGPVTRQPIGEIMRWDRWS